MPTLFIVAGPESSGNRLVASLLVAGGCRGEASTRQPEIGGVPTDGDAVIIAHDPGLIRRWLCWARSTRFDTHVVVVLRDWHATARSAVNRGHQPDLAASWEHLGGYYPGLFAVITEAQVPHTMVSYEAVVADRQAVSRWLMERLGLDTDSADSDLEVNLVRTREVYDANAKYRNGNKALVVKGYMGLGDNIYQRPFIRALLDRHPLVWLETPWPQVYWDLALERGLRFLKPRTSLRTQARNVDAVDTGTWSDPPAEYESLRIGYTASDIERCGSITRVFESQAPLGLTPYGFGFRPHPNWGRGIRSQGDKPVAIVRPATIRTEWRNVSRNPAHGLIQRVVDRLKTTHYVVSIADLCDGKETLDGPPLEGVDLRLEHGELGTDKLLAAICRADVVAGPVGFIMPLGIASGIKTFIVFGGCGGCNAPHIVTDPRMNLSLFDYVAPDPMCDCTLHEHDCAKDIDHKRLDDALDRLLKG